MAAGIQTIPHPTSSYLVRYHTLQGMDINEIKKVLDWVQEFQEDQESTGEIDRRKFALWLLEQEADQEPPPHLDGMIAMYIGLLYNYTTFYTRRLFKRSEVYSIIDHGFLMALMPDKEMTKTQLIQENIMEKSSGTEVIKRLLRQELIEELDNPHDKRARLVRLSEKGRGIVAGLGQGIADLSKVVTGQLTGHEKMFLLRTLEQLHLFHWDHFTGKKEEEIHALLNLS